MDYIIKRLLSIDTQISLGKLRINDFIKEESQAIYETNLKLGNLNILKSY